MEVERLAYATFGDYPIETRDRLSVSQFVSSLTNEGMGRELGFSGLGTALARALEIETVESISQSPRQNETRTRPSPHFNSYSPRIMDNAVIKKSPKANQERNVSCSFE